MNYIIDGAPELPEAGPAGVIMKLLPPASAAVRYHFLSVAVCVFACLPICRCLYVSNGLSVCMSMFVAMFVCQ